MKDKICGIIFKNNIALEKESINYKILKSTIQKQIQHLVKNGYNKFYIIYDDSNLNLVCFDLIENLKQSENGINLLAFLPYKLTSLNNDLGLFDKVIKIGGQNKNKVYKKIEKKIVKKSSVILSEKINDETFVNQKNINKNAKDLIFIDISKF